MSELNNDEYPPMIERFRSVTGRHATWLELFFDLVFVAVIGVVAHDLAKTDNGSISVSQFLQFPLVFIPVWWIWMGHTLYANQYDSDSRKHRFFALSLMGLMIYLSTLTDLKKENTFLIYTLIYVCMRSMLAIVYLAAHTQENNTKQMMSSILTGALICLSALLFTGYLSFMVFYLGILIDMLGQFYIRHTEDMTPDRSHLVERFGLLIIIILGESIIAMVASLSQTRQALNLGGTITGFVMIGSIWWVYFDRMGDLERGKRLTSANGLIYPHLLVCMGLLILANLIRHTILNDLDQSTFSMMAIAGLTLFYLGKQIPYWLAFPPWRKGIIINTIICVGCTIFSIFLPRIEFALAGMTVGMLIYVYNTYKRVMPKNIDDYLDQEQ